MFFIYLLTLLWHFSGFAEQLPLISSLPVSSDTPEVTWIFSPGIHCEGLEQLSKYVVGGYAQCGHYYAQTERSLEVIDPSYVSYVRYAEISPITNFIHPLSFLYNKIVSLTNTKTNNARAVKHNVRFSVNLAQVNFGQGPDIACLQKTFKNHKERFENNSKLMLYGTSRGAACLFNACALQEIPLDEVRGVILEGCFDDVHQVMMKGTLPVNTFLARIARHGFSLIYRGYDIQGPKPIDLVRYYPKNVPTLFITSEKDMLVPMHLTLNLFQALKNLGYENVYVLILKHSPHSEYMRHSEDQERYQKGVHAFYQICGVPHDPELAQKGRSLLITENFVCESKFAELLGIYTNQ